ncbi:MTTP family protein [Megaselia abdita]
MTFHVKKSSTVITFLLLILGLSCEIRGDRLVQLGSKESFEFKNEVKLGDLKKLNSKVGYEVDGKLVVSSTYENNDQQLLEFELVSPKFSSLEKGPKNQGISSEGNFAVLIKGDKIEKFYSRETKDVSALNLFRGLSSFFQFKFEDGKFDENDSSGNCFGFYHSKSSTKFTKTKTFCTDWDMRMNPKVSGPLGVDMDNFHEIYYDLTQDSRSLFKLESIERHSVGLRAKEQVGSIVESSLTLKHLESGEAKVVKTLEEVLEKYKEYPLGSEIDGRAAEIGVQLKTFIKAHKSDFLDENVGKEIVSILIAKALPIARETSSQEFTEILKSPSMKKSQSLLIDLLGAAQTGESHKAFTNAFQFTDESHFDQVERYLQAISIGVSKPDDIIEDLLTKTDLENQKLVFSLWQSIAALTSRCQNEELKGKVNSLIVENLEKCDSIDCKVLYLQSLQNLKNKVNVKLLQKYAQEGETKVSVAATRALYVLPVKVFVESDKKVFEKIFYQKEKKFDSTVRTLSLDILLNMKPSKAELQKMVSFLNSSCKQFEVKTYVLQKLLSLAERCSRFRGLLKGILQESPEINNYNVIAQKGLTTVLQRKLSQTPAYNESLLSINEIKSGVLKRGSVSMILGRDYNTFELGLFTSGLESFVGGNEDEGDGNEETSAGMEIAVQGVQFRPIVFFKGQTELMGHVWSGTASDRTPAYQATTIMQDSEHYIILQNGGVTINLKVFGARSIDLYGQIEFSLWNRNAKTQISKDAGLTTVGTTTLYNSFFNLKNNFVLTSEPKIKVNANIDFYTDILLCIQLGRPEMVLRYSNEKLLNFTPNGKSVKYSLNKSNKADIKLPGSTLVLNQKNNEMCNKIHGDN